MDVRPKKALGQHFLKNPQTARKICEAVPQGNINLLEIGPGMGVLTRWLINRFGEKLKVVELDRRAVEYLKEQMPDLSHDNVVQGDFLSIAFCRFFTGAFHIVGNFPYNISTQILFRVLENRLQVPSVTGMFQLEVAQRIAAGPGSKTYGILSVLVQAFYDTQILFTLPETAFYPPPKVKSAVIQLIRKPEQQLPCDESMFFKIVKQSFQQRRKTLRNSLKIFIREGQSLPSDLEGRRPEQLSVEEFIRLTLILQ